MKGGSPLVGYNTNVRHKGKLYHIQTEDSGVAHPHIVTHLFADGGRVIASRKTDYRNQLAREDLRAYVKQQMRAQHKAMFIALRDCKFDEDTAATRVHGPDQVTAVPRARRPVAAPAAPADSTREKDERSLDQVILSYLAREPDCVED